MSLCLWAGRHWCIVKAQDFILLHGEDLLGSCLGENGSAGGGDRKSPSGQAAWTQPRPSLYVSLCSLLPGGRVETAQGNLTTLCSPSLHPQDSVVRTICCAVFLLLTWNLMGERCHMQPLGPLGMLLWRGWGAMCDPLLSSAPELTPS